MNFVFRCNVITCYFNLVWSSYEFSCSYMRINLAWVPEHRVINLRTCMRWTDKSFSSSIWGNEGEIKASWICKAVYPSFIANDVVWFSVNNPMKILIAGAYLLLSWQKCEKCIHIYLCVFGCWFRGLPTPFSHLYNNKNCWKLTFFHVKFNLQITTIKTFYL